MSGSIKENDMQTFFPKQIEIKIFDKDINALETFYIQEFTFGNRIEFLKIIVECFKKLTEMNNVLNANNTEIIALLIEIAGDKLGRIYELVLGKNRAWIEKNVTLKTEIAIITAIVEVNEIPFLIAQVQKLVKARA